MRLLCSVTALALVLTLLPPGARAAEGYDDLLARVPQQANAILLIDVQGVFKSALGKQEGWERKSDRNALGGVDSLSPTFNKVVIAGQFNPTVLEHSVHVGLASTNKDISTPILLRLEQGTMDTVAEQYVVVSPRNVYYLALEPRLLGVMKPANRQELGRWIRAMKQGKPTLSPYLQQAAAKIGDAGQVVMAIDLADVLDTEGLKARLKDSPALAGKNVNLDALVKTLNSLQGMTVALRIGTDIQGELRIDFAQPVEALAPFAKPLILGAFERMGAQIDEMADWRVRTVGKSIILNGGLSEASARLILSPMMAPSGSAVPSAATLENLPADGPPTGAQLQQRQAAASQRYYHSIKTLTDDLFSRKADSFKKLSYWYYQSAKKIDELPMLHVDPELLKYGSDVSTTLRGLANIATGTYNQNLNIESQRQESVIGVQNAYNNYVQTPYVGYHYGPWGYGASNGQYSWSMPGNLNVSNYRAVYGLIAKNSTDEASLRSDTWRNIMDAGTAVRQKMTSKYGVEFR